MDITQKLIAAGVKNLRAYGYPNCDEHNICTDVIYRGFFRSMLKDNKGHSAQVDAAIDDLLARCDAAA